MSPSHPFHPVLSLVLSSPSCLPFINLLLYSFYLDPNFMYYSYITRVLLRVVQSENVVEHIVRVSVWNQVEHLGVTLRVLFLVNQQLTGHHDQNVAVWRSWLGVQGGNAVGHLLERQRNQLLHNVLGTLQLRGFEGQHGLVSVQVAQLVSVRVKLLVVEVTELGGHGVKVDCRLVRNQKTGTSFARCIFVSCGSFYIPDMIECLLRSFRSVFFSFSSPE